MHIFCTLYTEIYDLQYGSEGLNELAVQFSILDDNGTVVKSTERKYQKPCVSCVLSGGIPISGLGQGQYRLELTTEDLDAAQSVRGSIDFYLFKPERRPKPLYSQL